MQRITGDMHMAPFGVLVVSLLVFRGLGALGVGAFAAWQDDACYALALMFLFTASAHFTKTRKDLIAMVPPPLPFPRALVTFTGICEILGAIGLVIPATRGLAGIALVLLLLAVLPANINAALRRIPLRGRSPTPLWRRAPMQLVFIGLTLWASRA
jgi:uncharacterized membrane protein